jgi:hypothetical protein
LGIRGSPEEETILELNGFKLESDIRGEVCYMMPQGLHYIYLYADGSWHGDKAGSMSMEEYFAWLKESNTKIDAC